MQGIPWRLVSCWSPSTRRAWIEIAARWILKRLKQNVALHPEGVDRNIFKFLLYHSVIVALHPEGVDRNLGCRPVKEGN